MNAFGGEAAVEIGFDEGAPVSRRVTSLLLFLLVHRQHALGDEEAAEDVDGGERQRRARPRPWRSSRPRQPALAAAAISAPTMMTEEIALVTAISGVCSAGVTDQTT